MNANTHFLSKSAPLRIINYSIFGIILGFLLTQSLFLPLQILFDLFSLAKEKQAVCYFFLTFPITCLSVRACLLAGQNWHLSIPFIQLQKKQTPSRTLLIDASTLIDPRILDLASTGIFDDQLTLPKAVYKEWQFFYENGDEPMKHKAKQALYTIKKLESFPSLNLTISDDPLPNGKDLQTRLINFAKQKNAYLLISESTPAYYELEDTIKVINLHLLSTLLKPVTFSNESFEIKIQRQGKEAKQGIGYLEDGTMVVINGASEFIGETVKAHVLSTKRTASGRIIFCNLAEQEEHLFKKLNSMNGAERGDSFQKTPYLNV